jgi:hypothetical protein
MELPAMTSVRHNVILEISVRVPLDCALHIIVSIEGINERNIAATRDCQEIQTQLIAEYVVVIASSNEHRVSVFSCSITSEENGGCLPQRKGAPNAEIVIGKVRIISSWVVEEVIDFILIRGLEIARIECSVPFRLRNIGRNEHKLGKDRWEGGDEVASKACEDCSIDIVGPNSVQGVADDGTVAVPDVDNHFRHWYLWYFAFANHLDDAVDLVQLCWVLDVYKGVGMIGVTITQTVDS